MSQRTRFHTVAVTRKGAMRCVTCPFRAEVGKEQLAAVSRHVVANQPDLTNEKPE